MIASRRTFLKTAALGGASFVIGFDGRRLFASGGEYVVVHAFDFDPDI